MKYFFLIHPYYRCEIKNYLSTCEERIALLWYKEINNIAKDKDKMLIILTTSTEGQEKAVDTGLIARAKTMLQERCVILYYVERDIKEYAAELQKRINIDVNASSVAFGEYTDVCVLQIADELNRHLGFKKKTVILTGKSLPSAKEDTLMERMCYLTNLLHLKRVVIK